MRNYELTINGKKLQVEIRELSTEAAEVEINGTNYQVTIDQIHQPTDESIGPMKRSLSGSSSPSTAIATQTTSPSPLAGAVCAPIPGTILAIYVKTGDEVKAGQPLCKMEAMKMENEIPSPASGTVAAIQVSIGDSIAQGQELIQIAVTTPKRRQSDQ